MILWILFIVLVLAKFAPDALLWGVPFALFAFACWVSAGISHYRRKP